MQWVNDTSSPWIFQLLSPTSTRHAGAVPAQQLLEQGCAGAWVHLPATTLWSQLVEQIAVRLGLNLARLESGWCSAQCIHRRPFPMGPLLPLLQQPLRLTKKLTYTLKYAVISRYGIYGIPFFQKTFPGAFFFMWNISNAGKTFEYNLIFKLTPENCCNNLANCGNLICPCFCNEPSGLTSYQFYEGARIWEQPAPFTLSGQLYWHTFPANGATCRSAQGPVRTVSEGNADRAGGDVGGWWCRASVTGTSIRALSFPPVLMSAMGTHTKPGPCYRPGHQHMSGNTFSVIWVSKAQVNAPPMFG